jgi:hypothetical protein
MVPDTWLTGREFENPDAARAAYGAPRREGLRHRRLAPRGGRGMKEPFEYAVIRVVPRIERGEQINVGVILYCQNRDYLAARTHLAADRLRALDPRIDLDEVRAALEPWEKTCVGGPAGGPAAGMRPGERFRWLTAPRSTIIQAGPVHTGLTDDPAAELAHLLDVLVR